MYRNFKNRIDEIGISAYRVSKGAGVAYGTLSDWKLGKTTPKVNTLKKIAAFLNMSLEELLKED